MRKIVALWCFLIVVGWTGSATASLVAYYPFNGNADDMSGNGNNGTVYGATLTEDRFGNANHALYFDGNDYIDVPHSATLDITQAISISLWTVMSYAQSNITENKYLISKGNGAVNDYANNTYAVFLGNSDIDYFSGNLYTIGGRAGSLIDKEQLRLADFNMGQWYHLVMTWDGATIRIYKDGDHIQTADIFFQGNINSLAANLNIGRLGNGARYYKGSIDDVRIYDHALNDSEVLQLYTEPDPMGKISGVVTREVDGQPISGLTVRACSEGYGACREAETQTNGAYSITNLPPGDYKIQVIISDTDYVQQYYDNAYSSSDALPISVLGGHYTTGINFSLALNGNISGVVTRKSDSQPIAGLWVHAYDYSHKYQAGYAKTEADGSYTIIGLAASRYSVYIDSDRTDYLRQYYNKSFLLDDASLVLVSSGQYTTGIDFNLVIGGKISGTVTSESDGQPLSGRYVSANDYSSGVFVKSGEVQTDGSYTINRLPAGNYRLYVPAPLGTDYIGEYYKGVYSSQNASPVAVTLGMTTSGIDFSLLVGGRISGFVTRESDGQHLPGGYVTAYEYSKGYHVNSGMVQTDGSYTITQLPGGNYRVYASAPHPSDYIRGEYYNNSSQVNVILGQTTTGINFSLPIGAKVTGMVTAESDGKPISDVCIRVCDYSGSDYSGSYFSQSHVDGSYIINGLLAGTYRVEAYACGYPYVGTEWVRLYWDNTFDWGAAAPVAVSLGETATGIDFCLTSGGGRIEGVVTGKSDGQPIRSMLIELLHYPSDVILDRKYTGIDGTYSIYGLAPSSYIVRSNPTGTNYNAQYFKNTTSISNAVPVVVIMNELTTGIDFVLGVQGDEMGDLNEDGTVSIDDAILSLQVLVGMNPTQLGYESPGTNADDKTGLEDAIYVLRVIGGLR